jgi:hypothetical protein
MRTQKHLAVRAGLLLGAGVIAFMLWAGCGKSRPLGNPVTEADLTNLNSAPLKLDSQVARYDARPGSKVRIEGTSTVHDWQVEGPVIGGYLEVGTDFPIEPGQSVTPGKIQAGAEVVIPVRSLRSIEKDGKPYSDKMDDIMYGKLKQPTNPKIVYRLNELALKETPKAADLPYVFDSKGELAVAGVTNKISMRVNVMPMADKRLKVTGTTSVKMTDFGIQPPVLVGILSTGDEVKLFFEWIVAQRAAAK